MRFTPPQSPNLLFPIMNRNIRTKGGGYSYTNADGSKYYSNPDGSKFYDPGQSGKGKKWYESPDGVRHYMDQEPVRVKQEQEAFDLDYGYDSDDTEPLRGDFSRFLY